LNVLLPVPYHPIIIKIRNQTSITMSPNFHRGENKIASGRKIISIGEKIYLHQEGNIFLSG